MATSNEYSKLAEKCFRLAREAKTETYRLSCLDLAQKWLEASLRKARRLRGRWPRRKNLSVWESSSPNSHNFKFNRDGCSGCSGFSAGIDYTPDTVAGTKVPKFIHGE